MLEKDMQYLIKTHPEEFLKENGLELIGEEITYGNSRFDLIFKDRHGGFLLIEIQRGRLDRKHHYKILDYYDKYISKHPKDKGYCMVIANEISVEQKETLKKRGIEYKEILESEFLEFGEKVGYLDSEGNSDEKDVIKLNNKIKELSFFEVYELGFGYYKGYNYKNGYKIPTEQNIDKALFCFKEAINKDKDNYIPKEFSDVYYCQKKGWRSSEIHSYIGEIYYQNNDKNNAIKILEEGINKGLNCYETLSDIYVQEEEFNNAIQVLNSGITAHFNCFIPLAEVYIRIGNIEKAHEYWGLHFHKAHYRDKRIRFYMLNDLKKYIDFIEMYKLTFDSSIVIYFNNLEIVYFILDYEEDSIERGELIRTLNGYGIVKDAEFIFDYE